ncbi:MAG TPA: response regulator [Thermoanaerobaculia bacterium]|jgi:DNA-binding response OmpR family regulator|nr:response regulator [Thermoanaerobaculia bacterium]
MKDDPRVLIVESHDVLRVMLFTVLRHQPLGVDTAISGPEALEKVLSCDYALIIVDMDLPDGEALEFLNSFHDERPQATSFVLLVRDPKNDKPVDPELASAILNKPLELDTLGELVRECALVVPAPEDPLPCPPSESTVRTQMARAPYLSN